MGKSLYAVAFGIYDVDASAVSTGPYLGISFSKAEDDVVVKGRVLVPVGLEPGSIFGIDLNAVVVECQPDLSLAVDHGCGDFPLRSKRFA